MKTPVETFGIGIDDFPNLVEVVVVVAFAVGLGERIVDRFEELVRGSHKVGGAAVAYHLYFKPGTVSVILHHLISGEFRPFGKASDHGKLEDVGSNRWFRPIVFVHWALASVQTRRIRVDNHPEMVDIRVAEISTRIGGRKIVELVSVC